MAEELAKNRLSLSGVKLSNSLKAVKLSITVSQGITPTTSEKLLTRQVKNLEAAWKEYEDHMLKLQGVAASENVASYKDRFEKAHEEVAIVIQKAEEFLDSYNEPEEEETPDYDALATANAEVRANQVQDMLKTC